MLKGVRMHHVVAGIGACGQWRMIRANLDHRKRRLELILSGPSSTPSPTSTVVVPEKAKAFMESYSRHTKAKV
jgi:hypothetical protein